ncbi:MAG: response regulator [Dongiaceae bacterium]
MRSSRILVVEDELTNAFRIEAALTAHGHRPVGPARSVGAAMALIEREPVDAALLDLRLEDDLALPVAEALDRRGIPYAIVTGFDAAFAARLLPGRPYLAKPFQLRALQRLVAALLPEAGAFGTRQPVPA